MHDQDAGAAPDAFEVYRHEWAVPTRPCDYSLAIGDVAFADFGFDEHGHLQLIRISFDGYGCCTPDPATVSPMNGDDSAELIARIESDEPLATEAVRSMLRRYFEAHRTVVWEDALVDFGLVAAP